MSGVGSQATDKKYSEKKKVPENGEKTKFKTKGKGVGKTKNDWWSQLKNR